MTKLDGTAHRVTSILLFFLHLSFLSDSLCTHTSARARTHTTHTRIQCDSVGPESVFTCGAASVVPVATSSRGSTNKGEESALTVDTKGKDKGGGRR